MLVKLRTPVGEQEEIEVRHMTIYGEDIDVKFDIEMIDDELRIRSIHGRINVIPRLANVIIVKSELEY